MISTMSDAGLSERDTELTLRMCMLLDTVRSMHEARTSTGLREVLGNHMLAFVRELIPADNGTVLIDDLTGGIGPGQQMIEQLAAERGVIVQAVNGRQTVVAPLLVRNELAGTIYLERFAPAIAFTDAQLLILSALAQMISVALENAYQFDWLQNEMRRLERDLNFDDEMIGQSSRLNELQSKIARVAPADTTVLIIGESGTGKELVARSLHRQSSRASKPFVAINCAALTESLLESELFGHEKGAFTGAVAQKRGRLESGEGGSVFLDEIGEMPLSLQAKVLRVIQNREFERVGGTRTIPLNVRLIAATNSPLEDAVRRGAFRQDLYYRLNVVTLRTPPLRDRLEDVVPLAIHFANRLGEKCGRRIAGISPAARNALRGYDWPGNVRELENAIEHAVVLGSSDTILAEDLPESLRDKLAQIEPRETGMLQQAINSAKRAAVKKAFELSKQDHNEAARLLGVHPNYLYRLLRNMNLHQMLRAMSNE